MSAAPASPARLVAAHFAAALVFLLLGSAGLLRVAGDLALGLHPLPRVIAVTHLFTLGWITTSILGALYQFLAGARARPIASSRIAWLTLALHGSGLALFIAGLAFGRLGSVAAGAGALAMGLALFTGNLAVTLRRPPNRDLTWWALVGAATFLAVTLLVGLALALNMRWPFMATRPVALMTHVFVALAGWVLLVVIGVSHRMLPMFLLSHGGDGRRARVAAALVAVAAGTLTLLHHVAPVRRWVPPLLAIAGVIAFLAHVRETFRRRVRKSLEVPMRLAGAALVLLAMTAPLLAAAMLRPSSSRLVTAVAMDAVLAFTLLVAAFYYKLVPVLAWNARFAAGSPDGPRPRPADLFSARIASIAATLLAAGAAGLVIAVLFGSPIPARIAAAVFAAGAAIEAAQLAAVARAAIRSPSGTPIAASPS